MEYYSIKDREENEFHNITINATNTKSELSKSTLKVFPVRVLDVNDNAPYIVASSLTGRVSEAAGIGTEIMRLRGKDNDVVSSYDLVFLA